MVFFSSESTGLAALGNIVCHYPATSVPPLLTDCQREYRPQPVETDGFFKYRGKPEK
jgi:hypothetical protein